MHTAIRPPHRRTTRIRTARTCRAPAARRTPRVRDGRLLIECMLAALLLNATALVLVSSALGLVGAAAHAGNSTQTWAIGLQQLESAAILKCATPLSSGTTAVGLRRITWGEQVVGTDSSARDRTLDITQPTSAWARHGGLAAAVVHLRDARGCE